MPGDQVLCAVDEIVEGDGAFIAFGADADAYGVGGGFLVAHDEDEGDFLETEVADLALHLVVGGVEFYAEAGGFEALLDGFCVVQMLFADGDEADLYGG